MSLDKLERLMEAEQRLLKDKAVQAKRAQEEMQNS